MCASSTVTLEWLKCRIVWSTPGLSFLDVGGGKRVKPSSTANNLGNEYWQLNYRYRFGIMLLSFPYYFIALVTNSFWTVEVETWLKSIRSNAPSQSALFQGEPRSPAGFKPQKSGTNLRTRNNESEGLGLRESTFFSLQTICELFSRGQNLLKDF